MRALALGCCALLLPFSAIAGGSGSSGQDTKGAQCWGDDMHGQSSPPSGLPGDLAGVSAGATHTVAWTEGGEVHCWGHPDECNFPSLQNVHSACAGDFHSCAWWFAYKLPVCWGSSNTDGQQSVPAILQNKGVFDISCGSRHTCAKTYQWTAVCWGADDSGQSSIPSGLDGETIRDIKAGVAHTCAVYGGSMDIKVLCWGDNSYGQLNVPSNMETPNYVAVGDHSCATFGSYRYSCMNSVCTYSPSIACWGHNDRGQSEVPAGMIPLHYGVAAKGSTCTYQSSTKKVYCWGQLAASLPADLAISELTSSGANRWRWDYLANGGAHACAIVTVPAVTTSTTTVTATTSTRTSTSRTGTTVSSTTSFTTTSDTTTVTGTTLTATSTTSTGTSVTTTTSYTSTSTSTATTSTATTSTRSTSTETFTTIVTSTKTTDTTSTSTGTTVTTSSSTSTVTTSSTSSGTSTTSTSSTTTSTRTTSSTATSTATTSSSSSTTGTRTTSSTITRTGTTTSTSSVTGTETTSSTSSRSSTSVTSSSTSSTRSTSTTVTESTSTSITATSSSTSATGTSSTATTEAPPTATTTSRTATTTAAPALPPGVLAQKVKEQEATVISQVRNVSATAAEPLVVEAEGATLAGFALSTEEQRESWTVDVAGTEASITVPVEVLSEGPGSGAPGAPELRIFVVSVPETPVLDAEGQEEQEGDVLSRPEFGAVGLVSATMYTVSGKRVPVRAARAPIVLALPVNATPGLACAYWDEARALWSGDGVTTLEALESDGRVRCATTHLTLFAAVYRGFVTTLLCTNLELFSRTGFAALFDSDYLQEPIVLLYFFMLFMICLLFLVAHFMDMRRASQGLVDDEKFLIPIGRRLAFLAQHEAEEGEDGVISGGNLLATGPSGYKRAGSLGSGDSPEPTAAQSARLACTGCLNWCKSSSVLRDALDDIVSRWFVYFSEVRDLVESIWDGLGFGGGGPEEEGEEAGQEGHSGLVNLMLTSVLANSAKRQAAGSLGLSTEVVTFLLEDPVLSELLREASSLPLESDLDLEWKEKMTHWVKLHDEVVRRIDVKWHLHSRWSAFGRAAARLFTINNPWIAAFSNCHFWTSSQRVLFWACNLLGSIMVATLFYQATTTVRGKRSRQACSAMVKTAWEQVGRLLAITLVALVLAHIPVAFLASLHCRSIKKFDRAGCRSWRRQLRVWKLQDRLLWCFGLPYLSFCALFLLLFLANVAVKEMPNWAVTGAATLLEEFLLVPIGIGVLVPTTTMTLLSLVCWAKGIDKRAMLTQRRHDRNGRPGSTWYQVVNSI